MASVLESVKWGKQALQFLDSMKYIDETKPAVMYLRHSKADYTQVESPKEGTLTEEGIQTSIEFGTRLLSKYSYRIFHSPYPRAKISAEKLDQGIKENNGESKIIGPQDYLIFSKSNEETIMMLWERYGTDFTSHWLSGRFNPAEVESSYELAKEAAKQVTKNLNEIGLTTIDVYVNHDVTIVPMMFHWFGAYHDYNWTGHLDGFIMQLYKDKMVYIDKDGKHEVGYPYWWKVLN